MSIRAAYNSGIIDYSINGTKKYQEEANKEESILSDTESFMASIVKRIKKLETENNESNGTIKLSLTYDIEGITLKVYPQTDAYDKEYYDYLTETVLKNLKEWDNIDADTIFELTQYAIEDGWSIETTYNSLKEWYLTEHSDYDSCAEWAEDWLEALTTEEMNEALALLPEEYYITVTCNGQTQRIDLVETSYAEFTLIESGDYTVRAIDNQNNEERSVTVNYALPAGNILSNAVSVGDYVDINVGYQSYTSNDGTWRTSTQYSSTGWRVLRIGTNGVDLISTNVAMTYRHPEVSANSSVSILNSISTDVLSVDSQNTQGFRENGFSTNDVKSLFTNSIFRGISIPIDSDFNGIESNDSLRACCYGFWLADTELSTTVTLEFMDSSGIIRTAVNSVRGVRLIVSLNSNVLTYEGDGSTSSPYKLYGINY